MGDNVGGRRELSSLTMMNADMDSSICWGWIIVDWVESCLSQSDMISATSDRGLDWERRMWSVFSGKDASVVRLKLCLE